MTMTTPTRLPLREDRALRPSQQADGRAARRLGAVACLAVAILASDALAAAKKAPAHIAVRWSSAYDEHPVVREVQTGKLLGLLARERALSDTMPLDRAVAVVDAVGADGARRSGLGDEIARALRARHAIGPSGALLGKPIAVAELSGREALVLGWARALADASDTKALQRKGGTIAGAGALELLDLAATKEPKAQAPALAVALLRASLAPRKGKAACAAWLAVQTAARDGRSASVRLGVAEGAIAAISPLASACSKGERAAYQVAPSLPPPAPEVEPAASTGRRGPQRPTQRGGVYQKGIAWTVMAPFFKGYLQDSAIATVARGQRLDEIVMAGMLGRDPTGDLSIALVNASVLLRRVDFDDNLDIVWMGIVRQHGLLDADETKRRALPISALTATEAMALAYGKTIAGESSGPAAAGPGAPVDASQPAWSAPPRALFAWARQRVPGNASLGPIVALAHEVDVDRETSACAAAKRAEAVGFVIGKSSLPMPARAVLAEAMTSVQASCPPARSK